MNTKNRKTQKGTQSGFAKVLSQRKYIFLFILLGIIVLGLFVAKIYPQHTVKKTVMKQSIVTRSKDTGIINRGLTGRAIDVNTGKVIKAARIFSTGDKAVYLELDFNNAPKGTVIDYIRYKKGRYVDHGEIIITKDNTQNTLFTWTINTLFLNIRDGQWRIATYTNGILAKQIAYEVKNNRVSYVYPDQPINLSDPDYHLSTALSAKSQ